MNLNSTPLSLELTSVTLDNLSRSASPNTHSVPVPAIFARPTPPSPAILSAPSISALLQPLPTNPESLTRSGARPPCCSPFFRSLTDTHWIYAILQQPLGILLTSTPQVHVHGSCHLQHHYIPPELLLHSLIRMRRNLVRPFPVVRSPSTPSRFRNLAVARARTTN